MPHFWQKIKFTDTYEKKRPKIKFTDTYEKKKTKLVCKLFTTFFNVLAFTFILSRYSNLIVTKTMHQNNFQNDRITDQEISNF